MNDEEPNPVGKRTRPKRSDSFEAEVQSRFGPVVGRCGLEGPVVDGVLLPTVKYHTDRLTYTWMLDEDDKALTVDVDLVVAGGSLSIDVDALVVGAGLGARQQVRSSAQTWHSIQQSIDSHVQWLERLHPDLVGPGAERLLESAGARKFTPDQD